MTTPPGRYNLSDEHKMLQSLVRDYVRNEILPIERGMDPDAIALPEEDFRRLAARTRQMGLWCMESPEHYGGAGLDVFTQVVVEEERVQHRAGLYLPAYGTMGTPIPDIIWRGPGPSHSDLRRGHREGRA